MLGVAGLALLLYAALTAKGGVPDPTEEANLSTGAVVLNSGLLVLREGLEAILVLAAIIASFRGANQIRGHRTAADLVGPAEAGDDRGKHQDRLEALAQHQQAAVEDHGACAEVRLLCRIRHPALGGERRVEQ